MIFEIITKKFVALIVAVGSEIRDPPTTSVLDAHHIPEACALAVGRQAVPPSLGVGREVSQWKKLFEALELVRGLIFCIQWDVK